MACWTHHWSADVKVASRIGRETLVQMLGFGVQLADRIIIAGLLVRLWGVDDFASWSLAMAAGGLVGLFDFGVNLYFANRVLFLVQQGKRRAARVLQRAGNALVMIASVVGLVAVIVGFGVFGAFSSGSAMSGELWLAASLIALGIFFRAATPIQASLYRAHELYARQSLLWIGGDIARIVGVVATVLAGGGILDAAIAFCAIAFVTNAYVVWIDSPRLFPDFPFRAGPMPRRERARAFGLSMGFWFQSAPSTALTYLPVFLLADAGSKFAVAQFVLMRTLANFVRAALQPFSVVFGQESARRVALGDVAGLSSTYRESTYLLAALGAVPAGLILALGPDFFAVWTGRGDMFDLAMLALAIAPPLLLPSLAMAASHLAVSNDPWPIAAARAIQVAASILGYFVLPIASPALRMTAALAVGEVVGMGIVLTSRICRMIPGTGVVFHLSMFARLSGAALLTYGAARLGMTLADTPIARIIAASACAGIAGGIGLFVFGIEHARRRALVAFALARLRPRSA